MKFKAHINVMPLDELLDPQGKVVTNSLHNLGLHSVENVRIGKHIKIEIEAQNRQEAEKMVEQACKKLLANLIMENYKFELEEVA